MRKNGLTAWIFMLILRWILYTRVTPECMFWRFWGWFWDVWGVFGSSFVCHCSVFGPDSDARHPGSDGRHSRRELVQSEPGGHMDGDLFQKWPGCSVDVEPCSAHVQQVSTCWTLVSAKTFNILQHLSTVSWLVQSLQHPTTCISSPQFLRHVLQIPMHHCHRLQCDLLGYCCR